MRVAWTGRQSWLGRRFMLPDRCRVGLHVRAGRGVVGAASDDLPSPSVLPSQWSIRRGRGRSRRSRRRRWLPATPILRRCRRGRSAPARGERGARLARECADSSGARSRAFAVDDDGQVPVARRRIAPDVSRRPDSRALGRRRKPPDAGPRARGRGNRDARRHPRRRHPRRPHTARAVVAARPGRGPRGGAPQYLCVAGTGHRGGRRPRRGTRGADGRGRATAAGGRLGDGRLCARG